MDIDVKCDKCGSLGYLREEKNMPCLRGKCNGIMKPLKAKEAPTSSPFSEGLSGIAEARDKVKEAEKIECTCSGFVLQCEGVCRCAKGRAVVSAKAELANLINAI